jgi:hypothetical protein
VHFEMIRQLKFKNIAFSFEMSTWPRTWLVFAELSESDLSSLLEKKDAKNTKKATKVK